jgi:hypothetical protein
MPAFAGMTVELRRGCAFAFLRRDALRFAFRLTLTEERARGKPGADCTHGSREDCRQCSQREPINYDSCGWIRQLAY